MTIASQLTTLNTTKTNIKAAIEAKGVTVGAVPFADYPAKIAEISGGGGIPEPDPWTQTYYNSVYAESTAQYQRPTDWLSLPATGSTPVCYGLYAVFPTVGNFLAINVNTDYTVDWGDGVVESFTANTQANHSYNYNDLNSSTTTSFGYRQAIVTITPTGNSTIDFRLKHPSQPSTGSSSNWLDLTLKDCWLAIKPASTPVIFHRMLESIKVDNSITATGGQPHVGLFEQCVDLKKVDIALRANQTFTDNPLNNMFKNCRSLISVNITTPYQIPRGDLSQMFSGCSLLTAAPFFDTSSVTNMGSMFINCSLLRTVPLFNTQNVTNMGSMFNGCARLERVPQFNTINVTGMSQMFSGCQRLPTVPLFDTQAVTSMEGMFASCSDLIVVPQFNTQNVTNMISMFVSCSKLTTVPLFNTIKVTNMTSMFSSCPLLDEVPQFNTQNVTNMGSMFQSCLRLERVPQFNTIKVTNMSQMFTSCISLTEVPLFDTQNVTNMNQMLGICSKLTTVPLFNTIKVTNMSQMFTSCISLTEVPLFDTQNVTNMAGMLGTCLSLATIPQFNTSKVTDANSMFTNCQALETVPTLDFSACNNLNSIFQNCYQLHKVEGLILKTGTGVSSSAFSNMFANCNSLKVLPVMDMSSPGLTTSIDFASNSRSIERSQIVNIKRTHSYANNTLGPAALEEIFTNLFDLTGLTAQTITITGNWGAALLTTEQRAIATGKNWVITG